MINNPGLKPLVWMGSSRKDFSGFPDEVKSEMGFALYLAQGGGRHSSTKLMKGVGAGVIEVIQDHRGDTFRTVYTVRFGSAVYVLHAFQKKSKSGIATPKPDIDLMLKRLRDAQMLDEQTR